MDEMAEFVGSIILENNTYATVPTMPSEDTYSHKCSGLLGARVSIAILESVMHSEEIRFRS